MLPNSLEGMPQVARPGTVIERNVEERNEEKRRAITTTLVNYGEPEFEEAQDVEFQVFLDKHYIELEKNDGADVTSSDTSHKVLEFEPFDERSKFIITRNELGEITGVLRIIKNEEETWRKAEEEWRKNPMTASTGFKTLDDFQLTTTIHDENEPEEEWDWNGDDEKKDWLNYVLSLAPNTVFEVGTVAIPKDVELSSIKTITHLYGELFEEAVQDGRTTLIASLDHDLFLKLKRLLGFKQMGPSKDYMGSLTTPAILDIEKSLESLQKNHRGIYQMIVGSHV